MKRELKFRAWDKNRKIWIRSIYNHNKYIPIANSSTKMIGAAFDECSNEEYVNQEWNENDIEITQYINYKDKNNLEIYEGDIIKLLNGQTGVVEYGVSLVTADDNFCSGEALCFYLNFNNESHEALGNINYEWGDASTTEDSIEVIGNIYQNPELINNS